MSNLFEDTPTKELYWLLKQIREREVALPDFQRDFVWEPGATRELIISIASNIQPDHYWRFGIHTATLQPVSLRAHRSLIRSSQPT